MLARRRTRVTLVSLVVGVLLGLLGPAAPAFAHTELVHWQFSGGTADKPQRLLLRFSEPIDARFLTVAVTDQGGNQIALGAVQIDPQRRTDGFVGISALSAGTYSVAWWTRALDGDPSNGSFLMGMGTKVDPIALLHPVGARDPATQPAMLLGGTAWDTFLHWLTYLGAALMIGSVGFVLIVWRPSFHELGVGSNSTDAFGGRIDANLLRTFRNLAVAGGFVFLWANLVLLVMQVEFVRYALLQPVTSVAPTPLSPSVLSHAPPYKALADIFSGYNGKVWIARIALVVISLVLSFRLSPSGKGTVLRWGAVLVSALAALLTVSLTAHAAVVPQSRFSVAIDWSHMTAMGLWLGGLLPLLLTLVKSRKVRAALAPAARPTTESPARQAAVPAPPLPMTEDPQNRVLDDSLVPVVVRRFSTMALICVTYLAATGLFAAHLHVWSPSLLIPTIYGRALIVKLALFAALFGLGALHRRVSIPRLGREARGSRSALERLLPIEMGVGLSLLLAVALMASLGTSAAVWPAHQALGLVSQSKTAKLTATFRAVPGKAGENAVALDVADRRSGQATTIERVTIEIDGRTLVLTPVGSLVPGSVHRFVSRELVDMPEGKKTVVYTLIRPTYPEASHGIPIQLPAALSGKK